MKVVDLTGKRFERLVVLSQDGLTNTGHKKWKCACDCGAEVSVRGTLLTQGLVKSCGCFQKDEGRRKLTKHGCYYHSAYAVWSHMMDRCYNPKSDDYPDYGRRGIKVCERWHDVKNFCSDMGERPKGMSIDRFPDVNGNYEPGNCRWADGRQQANNRRSNVFIEHEGRTQTIAEWASEFGIKRATLWARLNRGVPIEEALRQ